MFSKTLHRTGFLTGALEPMVAPGVRTSTDAAYTLWDRNRELRPGQPIVFDDVADRHGEMAPVTMKDATHEDTPEIVAERHRRIGNIFQHILNAAKRGEMIVAQGGYDLSKLGRAIQDLLDKKLAGIHSVEELEAAEARIQAEVVLFLSSVHGE